MRFYLCECIKSTPYRFSRSMFQIIKYIIFMSFNNERLKIILLKLATYTYIVANTHYGTLNITVKVSSN